MLKHHNDIKVKEFYDCHAGHGRTLARLVMQAHDSQCRIQFMHDDTLAPGTSIGEHPHYQEEEIYYIINGTGHFIYDGQSFPANSGDVLICSPGHSHGIVNTGNTDLRLIVFNVRD